MKGNMLRFGMGGLALVAVAVGVLFLVDYVRYRTSPEYRAEQYFKDLERRYREDPYGGTTPEETLQLFIDALKKGDVELASRYFVLEKQDEWRSNLLNLREQSLLDEMVTDFEKAQRGKDISVDSARFILRNERSEVITVINVLKASNGRWKINSI